jgi:hypothetical protein
MAPPPPSLRRGRLYGTHETNEPISPMSPIRATPPNPIEDEDDDEDEDDSCGRWPICPLSSVICGLSFILLAAYHRPDF